MSEKIRVVIITATNIRTSTGSNNTVLNLLGNLDPVKYQISIALVDDLVPKRLMISQKKLIKDPAYISFEKIKNHDKVFHVYLLSTLSLGQIKKMFDVAIVAIYNEFGEDGKTLGFLDLAEIPYLSPRLNSSVVAFDKMFTKAVLFYHGLLVPKSIEINKKSKNQVSFSYPLIVKPTSNGASRGTTLVKKESSLKASIKKAFDFSEEVLIEEYIEGQEFTVGVIGKYTDPKALPVVMIKSRNEFFDYEAKYVSGKAEEICPAPISKELELNLRQTAIKAYQAIKAENHSRIDMIKKGNDIYVLEINSFPGLISTSLFPKELNAAGLSLAEFLDTSIEEKLKKR